MKRIFCMILALVMALGIFAAIPSAAPAATVPQVAVNCVKVDFPDAQPYIDSNGRTLIPVRLVTEKLGATVNWDETTRTAAISKDGTTVEITIGDANMKVTKDGNTSTVKMDTAAVLKDGRTYVPIRYVAEELGAFVDWANYFQIVDIVLPSTESGLTAADIKRLRSYDVKETQVNSDEIAKRLITKAGEEYNSELWDKNYTFANAHFVALTSDPTPLEIQDWDFLADDHATPKQYYVALPKGSSNYELVQFLTDVAKASFENEKSDASYVTGINDDRFKEPVKVTFSTDPSLVYTQKGPDFYLYSIRGVVSVRFQNKEDENYFLTGKAGATTFDYEYVCGIGHYVSKWGAQEVETHPQTDFYFKNGNAIRHWIWIT